MEGSNYCSENIKRKKEGKKKEESGQSARLHNEDFRESFRQVSAAAFRQAPRVCSLAVYSQPLFFRCKRESSFILRGQRARVRMHATKRTF